MKTQNIQLSLPLSFEQVVEIVKKLSPSEKQQLREVLLTEQGYEDFKVPEEHKQLVRERIKKYENNTGSYISWDDIEQKMDAIKWEWG